MLGIALSIRFTKGAGFNVTPMDYLIVLAVLVLAVLASNGVVDTGITAIVLKTIILFYGSELVFNRMKNRWNPFNLAVLVSLHVK